MTIKTYRAGSVSDALAQVKKDLGPDAVILHTRTYKSGGMLGLGAQTTVEITATNEMRVGSREQARSAKPQPPKAQDLVGARVSGPIFANPPKPLPTAPETFRSPAPTPQVRAAARDAVASIVAPAPSPGSGPAPDAAAPNIAQSAVMAQLRDEMATVKRMVGRILQSSGTPSCAAVMPEALQSCYLKLLESEVASEIADSIVNSVRESLSNAQLADAASVHSAVMAHLCGYIPAGEAASPAPEQPRDGRPLTIALVGPTGVGKTTTLAKLAATYKLRRGKRVGLVTSDTYRIAAVDQLRVYANIIGLPLQVTLTPAEMAQACESLRDCDVILIDTAGRAPGDAGKLDELGRFINAAMPHQVHLVLSSTSSQTSMNDAAARFTAVAPTHLIFTKLDEAVNFGVLINVCRRIDARLSFITTGQEVPDQIEPGCAQRLARLVLEGGAAR